MTPNRKNMSASAEYKVTINLIFNVSACPRLIGGSFAAKMFGPIRRLKEFEHQYLPHLQSHIDFMVIAEIGYYQEQGSPLTVKKLLLLDIGAPATVQRHLRRLVRLGLVRKRRLRHDRRVWQLEIDAAVRKTYAKYVRLLSRL